MAQFEDSAHLQLHVVGKESVSPEHLVFEGWDAAGRSVRFP
jgi:hypothetical protein